MVTLHCSGQNGGTQEWEHNCQKEICIGNLEGEIKESK